MAQPELTYATLAQRVRLDELPLLEPSTQLWPRIAAARQRVVRRRRVRIVAGVGALALFVLLAIPVWLPRSGDTVDWQARAQALELQLRALAPAAGSADVGAMQLEIANLDRTLQTAYDEGGDESRLSPLWKKRSELLDALLEARRRHLLINRI
jgi:hypothetical protein